MTDQRWRAVWDIYEAACELPPSERRRFAASASADSEVAARVSVLLDGLEAAAAVDEPTAEAKDDWPQLGNIFGRFVVTSALGRGATGEVYAGRDTELDRAVALKFLGQGILGSAGAVNQMVREAQTASALNHPGIVTVHEVIRSGPVLAIVMELVEGQSLRAFCGSPNRAATVAEWGRQAARAIEAAHANRIVHRDIKPENLMLRPDGFIKILDFGMARRFTGDQSDPAGGMAAGTLRYMSPEQVRSGQAGASSDIFSLGIVLYELATGVHPFRSDSALETPYAIATRKPESPRALEAAIPEKFEDLILKMLDKNPLERPGAATVAKALADLHAGATSGKARRGLNWRPMAAALAGVAAILLAAFAWNGSLQRRHAVRPLETPRASGTAPVLATFSATDSSGNEGNPVFSPDGTRFAYEWDRGRESDNRAICVKPVVAGQPLVLTKDDHDYFSPAWSPDGLRIAFLQHSGNGLSVLIVPSMGGEARSAGSVTVSRPPNHPLLAWTPDGRSLIVSDEPAGRRGDLQFYRLGIQELGIQEMEKRAFLSAPEGASDVAPAFSPDGKTLAFLRLRTGTPDQLMIADADSAHAHELISSGTAINSFSWTPDGRSLVYSSGSPVPSGLWQVAVSGGVPREAPFRLRSPARQLAIAMKGNHLAYSRPLTDSNVWRLHPESGGRMEPFLASTREDLDPRYSPDGQRIAFASRRTENLEIWIASHDGSDATQITFQGAASGSPNWSPNGKQIAFDSSTEPSGLPKAVWLLGADGSHPRRLVIETGDSYNPSWSRDGAWVYFGSRRSGKSQIWKARVSGGGPPQVVTRDGGFEAYETLDGKYLYYTKEYLTAGVWRVPVTGGDEEQIPELDPVVNHRYWEMAERGIYFVDSAGTPRLRFFKFATRQVITLATLPEAPPKGSQAPSQIVRGLSAAPDGRSFLDVRYGSDRVAIVMADLP